MLMVTIKLRGDSNLVFTPSSKVQRSGISLKRKKRIMSNCNCVGKCERYHAGVWEMEQFEKNLYKEHSSSFDFDMANGNVIECICGWSVGRGTPINRFVVAIHTAKSQRNRLTGDLQKELEILESQKQEDCQMSNELNKYKMMGEYMFIEQVEDIVNGKVFIPDTAKEITQKGIVISMGAEGDKNIKLGDIVLFKRRDMFKKIRLDSKDYLVLKKGQVLGVMFGDDAVDVTPTKDWIFIEWEVAQDKYEGTGLIRPDAFRQMHFTGVVRAVGPDVKELVWGDRIFFDQFCGVEKFEEDGKRYTFLKEEFVYCKNLPARKEVAA